MTRLLRIGAGAFALTFTLAFGASVLDATPRAPSARAEAVVASPAAPLAELVPVVAVATVRPPEILRLAPVPRPSVPVAAAASDLDLDPELAGPWSPPDWFPEATRAELWALDGLDGQPERADGPLVHSKAAFVYDVDAGRVLYAREADERRPVASLTKVVAGLAALSEDDAELTREVCISPAQWPGWPGARSYLNTGTCVTGWDLLGAALVASDNRAAFGLARVSGLPFGVFVARMNEVAADLGMSLSTFADPAGVDDENLSTARDMSRAVLAASLHPVLGPVASAPSWDISETRRDRSRRLFSTNRLAGDDDIEVLAAKTGYTDTARYCFSAVLRTPEGRRVALSVLGAPNNRTRWADVSRIVRWVDGT